MAGYNIDQNWDYMDLKARVQAINSASDEDIAKWASDADCNQRLLCTIAIKKRSGKKDTEAAEKSARIQANPFDARNDISVDARYIAGHIVKHMWIILVALPFLLAILYQILK